MLAVSATWTSGSPGFKFGFFAATALLTTRAAAQTFFFAWSDCWSLNEALPCAGRSHAAAATTTAINAIVKAA